MIEIHGLYKRFGKQVALQEINLSIQRGRVTGIIGPNGSGKTTLVKCLLGLVTPTSGRITIDGKLLDGASHYRKNLGYVPQAASFPLELTGREILNVIRGLRDETETKESELLKLFGLKHEIDKRVKAMSGGTRQKLSVVAACMYSPELLILDEPTAGLDPISNIRLKEYISQLRDDGCTILLTSHIMSDLEELADDVVILLDGVLRFLGSVRDLKVAMEEPSLEKAVALLLERGAA